MNIKSQKSEVRSQKSEKRYSKPRTTNSKLFLILGGARSGKSVYALKLAESISGKKLFLATGEPFDDEMIERIQKHKEERGNNWITIEEPINVAEVIRSNKKYNVILLDCLTLWVSNLMRKKSGVRSLPPNASIGGQKSEVIYKNINQLASACKQSKATIIVVSNEVGLGIVPDNSLARRFRDIAGYANQKIAATADAVYFVVAGIEVKMK